MNRLGEHGRAVRRSMLDALGAGRFVTLLALLAVCASAQGASYPAPAEADFVIRDFHFASGESLPELRIHYRTFGQPHRDARGVVRNAVLILHGTGGSGASLVRDEFAGELFGPGQPLDATRYFIVLPDGIGHGKSSKPSDGLHAHVAVGRAAPAVHGRAHAARQPPHADLWPQPRLAQNHYRRDHARP